MEVRIDKTGRIVVPKALRERFGFAPDAELEVIERPEGMLLRRAAERPAMVKENGFWVHDGAAAPGTDWEAAVESAREARIAAMLRAEG